MVRANRNTRPDGLQFRSSGHLSLATGMNRTLRSLHDFGFQTSPEDIHALCLRFGCEFDANGAKPIAIGMTADHWQTKKNAEFLQQLGFYYGQMRTTSSDGA